MTTNTTLPDDVASTRDTRKAKVADHTHGIDHSIDQIASVITGATLHLETINKNLAGLGYDPISVSRCYDYGANARLDLPG